MIKYLRGIDVPAWAVGVARGALETAVFAGLAYLLIEFTAISVAHGWTFVIAALPGVYRFAESIGDHIDPAKKRSGAGTGESGRAPLLLALAFLLLAVAFASVVGTAEAARRPKPVTCELAVAADSVIVTTGLPGGTGVWYALTDGQRTFFMGGDSAGTTIALVRDGLFSVRVSGAIDGRLLAECEGTA